MRRSGLTMLAAPFVAMTLIAATYAHAQAQPVEPPSLTVSGEATVIADADQIEIGLSVVTEGEQSKGASEENNRRVTRILEALIRAGLDAKEATTGSFQIQPIYASASPRSGGDQTRRITGFRVENSISIKSKKLAIAGDVVQSAIDAGANRVQYLNFTLSDQRPSRLSALREAVQNARAEATIVAGAAGVVLKGIRRVTIERDFDRPMFARAAMTQDAVAATPLVAGEVSVSARVTIEFDIADKPNENR